MHVDRMIAIFAMLGIVTLIVSLQIWISVSRAAARIERAVDQLERWTLDEITRERGE